MTPEDELRRFFASSWSLASVDHFYLGTLFRGSTEWDKKKLKIRRVNYYYGS